MATNDSLNDLITQQEDSLFRMMFDAIPVPTFILVADGDEVLLANKAFRKTVGELSHHHFTEILCSDCIDAFSEAKESILNGNAPNKTTLRFKANSSLYLNADYQLIKKGDEVLVQVTLSEIVDNSPKYKVSVPNVIFFQLTGVSVQKLRFVQFSEPSENTLGIDSKWILDDVNYFLNAIHPEDATKFEKALEQSLLEQKPLSWVGRMYHARVLKWLSINAQIAIQDNIATWEGYITDISTAKEQEQTNKNAILVANKISHPVIVFDGVGSIEWVNEAFSREAGYLLSEVQNTNISNLLERRNVPLEEIKHFSNQLYTKKTFRKEFFISNKSGEFQWLEFSVTPIFNEFNELVRFVSVNSNITERKRLEQDVEIAKDRLELATKSENKGVWDWNLRTNEVYFSPRWKEMLGYEEHELTNAFETFEKLVHPEDYPNVQLNIQTFLSGISENYAVEMRMQHKNGEYIWILTKGTAQKDERGKPHRMVGSHTDITGIKEFENHLKVKNEELKKQRDYVEHLNTEMVEKNRKTKSYLKTLISLSKNKAIVSGELDQAFELITQTVAKKIDITRVSIWSYELEPEQIICKKLFSKLDESPFSSEFSILAEHAPTYFEAIKAEQTIVAPDVFENDVLGEFNEGYFKPLEIHSLLDVPFFIDGKLAGVICCEHQKEQKDWIIEDVSFLKSITDIITITFNAARRKEVELRLKVKNRELQTSEEELRQNMEELQAIQEIMATKNEELDVQNKKMLKSIQYAKTIQHTILPSKAALQQIFEDSFLIYKPKDIVSGDFYWLSQHQNKKLVGMIDCTGHGVPGAFMSLIGHNILHDTIQIKNILDPKEILNLLHKGICEKLDQYNGTNKDGMDLGFLLIEELENNQVKLTFAGARNTFYYSQNNELLEIRGERKPIGGVYAGSERDYKNTEIMLSKGEVIYMFTDGFADQANMKREGFGKRQLKELFQQHYQKPLNVQKEIFLQALQQHQGKAEQRDDITVLGFGL